MTAAGPLPELISLAAIVAARRRIEGAAIRTPLVLLEPDEARAAGFTWPHALPPLYLKDESAQPIGSFKLRGAYNKVAALKESDPDAFRRGVITFSSGNHAQGVAYAARALGTKAVIVMPNNAPEVKRAATAALGAEIVTVGPASTDRKRKAEQLVADHGYAMIPPYDDPFIIAGQATCGLELAEALHPRESAGTLILSPVSGGGLLSGVATGVKLALGARGATLPQVWGCEPEVAADAHESFYTGRLVEWSAERTSRTLADGLRTQSMGTRNFAHVLRFCDGIVMVSELEIRIATRILLAATAIVAEPSGAVTLAAALFHHHALPPAERIFVVVSGGNIDPLLRAELERETADQGAAKHV